MNRKLSSFILSKIDVDTPHGLRAEAHQPKATPQEGLLDSGNIRDERGSLEGGPAPTVIVIARGRA